MKKPAVEIREKPPGQIDEIIAKNCTVHFEQMSADSWYVGINGSDGSYWQFWLGARNHRAAVDVRHTETSPAGVEKKRRRLNKSMSK